MGGRRQTGGPGAVRLHQQLAPVGVARSTKTFNWARKAACPAARACFWASSSGSS